MKRIASIMYLKTGMEAEYEKRHDELWPEMKDTLKEHGASNYSIFLEPASGKLFAYLEVNDEDHYNQISATDICQKWWAYMEPLMETNADNSPISTPLTEVFYLE
ncbi:MAG TPA: L-rhamnose mutarotase [Candidatus Jeotgalibaca pullicola]|nr:L-rhamnose mutarotase [Candidatus Jeotgalibaca pullicola]